MSAKKSKKNSEVNEIRKAVEEVKTDIMNDLEDNNVNIRIETDGDTIEIKARTRKNDEKVKQLEDLESGGVEKNDTVRKNN